VSEVIQGDWKMRLSVAWRALVHGVTINVHSSKEEIWDAISGGCKDGHELIFYTGEDCPLCPVKVAASEVFDCLYRDINVTERGRTKPQELDAAYQKLGEALGMFGGPSQSLPSPRKDEGV